MRKWQLLSCEHEQDMLHIPDGRGPQCDSMQGSPDDNECCDPNTSPTKGGEHGVGLTMARHS